MSTQPILLGAYLGNPNGNDPTSEARFETQQQGFTAALGTAPKLLDTFVDQTLPVGQWVTNSGWQAWSDAQSSSASTMTPVIAVPLTSTSAGSMSADGFYKAFAAGTYDSVLQGMVKTWSDNGFATQIWRPGWEMNLSSMPSYAGDDAATQADWVKAFQHVSTVLHQAGKADGVSIQVAWNPSVTNYSNAEATTALYPGNNYVDIIAADVYSDLAPYGQTNAIYDWAKSGQMLDSPHPVYSTLQQWASDPINLAHYYADPAATQWSLDGSGGHSLSLQNLLDFAKAQGKPFAVAEAGAGSTQDGAGVSDNPTFVTSLATALANSGVPISFVNVWDSNGGGNYEFSNTSDNKSLEAAAWGQSFGIPVTQVSSSGQSAASTIGSGPDTVQLSLSEDAAQGDARAVVLVDGWQVGGVFSVSAAHGSGAEQTVLVKGNWGPNAHTVSVDLLNGADAPGGRHLYVDTVNYDGAAQSGASLALTTSGKQSVGVFVAAPSVTIGTGSHVLDLKVAEDAFQGDAQFTISVDGVQLGGTQTAQTSQASGSTQDFKVQGDWGSGNHTVAIDFLNDAYGGSASMDRNLYLDGASYDGVVQAGATLSLPSEGAQSITVVSSPAVVVVGAGADVVDLSVAEDGYKGDALFTVGVDGVQVGGTQIAQALRSMGNTQDFQVKGNWGAGSHTVAVNFLNDLCDGSAATDRNLFVTSASYNGVVQSNASLALMSAGTQSLVVQGGLQPAVIGSGSDVVDLSIAEDAYKGDALFTVSVDGVQVGGTQTAQASRSAGNTQDFQVEGNWGAGSHTVSVNFLNDLYDGSAATDRNLFVTGASYNGVVQSNASLSLMSAGTQSLVVQSGLGPVAIGSGSDVVDLSIAEDAYKGDALFTVSVDGVQVGGTQTAQALRSAGNTQDFQVRGNWGAGTHTVAVNFLNDLYDGSAATDRNLFVSGASYNGVVQPNASLALMSAGTQSFQASAVKPDSLILNIAEDAWQGDAQFTVSVDGVQVGAVYTAQASNAAGASQPLTLSGNWGQGSHAVTVNFLNDAFSGPGMDRNLYVTGASYDGAAEPKSALSLFSGGAQTTQVTSSTDYDELAWGGNITTLGNDTVEIHSHNVNVYETGPSLTVQGGTGTMTFIGGMGTATINAGSGSTSITGGSGPLTYHAGSGDAAITAGMGKEAFNFVSGMAGGTTVINGFTSGTDTIHLNGYAGTGVASQTVTAAGTSILLTDNTRIMLAGFGADSSHPVYG